MPSTFKVSRPDFKFKVIVIGEPSKIKSIPYGKIIHITIYIGVGKTSILNRFLNPEIQVRCTYVWSSCIIQYCILYYCMCA